jgi:hypothetical protein
MFDFVRKKLLGQVTAPSPPVKAAMVQTPPASVSVAGRRFDLSASLHLYEQLPHLDWQAVRAWVEPMPEEADRHAAWSACEAAWLEHLAWALGDGFEVYNAEDTMLLTNTSLAEAKSAMRSLTASRRDVLGVLESLARDEGWGDHIVILCADQDSYYRYVSRFYPDAGEFAFSGGMFINAGCAHFVSVQSDFYALQPVIAHETTHALLAHLSIPAWLNEGLAVNTERRLFPPPVNPTTPGLTPQQMHRRHQNFWGFNEVQEFWSGKSFLRNDEGNELSYDLARILVSQFSKDWHAFVPFANAAVMDDAGQAAAREHLGLDLGLAMAAVLEREAGPSLAPDPTRWTSEPERGGF